MTREAKVGLMMVAVLVGVFGFLLYKRIHRPAEAFAEQRVVDDQRAMAAEIDLPPQLDDEDLLPRRKKEPTRIARDIKKIEHGAGKVVKGVEKVAQGTEKLVVDTVEELNPFANDHRRREKPKLPTQIPSEHDEFSQFERPREPEVRPSRKQEPEVVEDAFGDAVEQLAPPKANFKKSADTSSDPFEEDGSDSVRPIEYKNEPRRDSEYRDESRRGRSVPLPRDLDERREVTETRRTSENLDIEINEEPPRRSRELDDGFDSRPRDRRRPAPIEFSDDSTFVGSATQTSGVSDGHRYVVQPNDNFWSISRKCYGAGRFYMALAKHNRDVISDPKMMKPGVTIATPDVSVLEQRYSDVIPKAGLIDSTSSVTTTQTRKSASIELAGYFVDGDGAPMYRVGEQDTLTGIAKSHLGRTSRWVQILEMNRNVLRDGNELRIGTILRLPCRCEPCSGRRNNARIPITKSVDDGWTFTIGTFAMA